MTKPIIPVYAQEMPDGKMLWGLGPEDFERVRQGYACGSCLEVWDFYQPRCPTCGLPVNAEVVPTPRHWLPSPPDEDTVAPRASLADASADSALGELGRWLEKKRR